MGIKLLNLYPREQTTKGQRLTKHGAKQRAATTSHAAAVRRGERFHIPADEVRRLSWVKVSDGKIRLKHKRVAAGTHGTKRPISGVVVKVNPDYALIELEDRSGVGLKSQIAVPTRRLGFSMKGGMADIPLGTKVLLNIGHEQEVRAEKRTKVGHAHAGFVNVSSAQRLDMFSGAATAPRRSLEVTLPRRSQPSPWRLVRPAQVKVEKYIGTVKGTEDDEVLVSVTPVGDVDTREVYIPARSFEHAPQPGDRLECTVLSTGSFTTTRAKLLGDAPLPKLEDFGLSKQSIQERIARITFGRSDD